MTPLLQQTLLLAVVGLIAYSCRALNSFVWNTLSRLAFVSISVNSGDEVYYMLNRWLMERKQEEERKIQKKYGPTSFLRVLNKYRIVSQRAMQDDVPYHRDFDEASNDEDRWRVMWLPGFGTFSSDVEGVPLWVTMKNGKGRAGYALSSPKTTTITTYVWHMPKLKAFVDESIRAYRESSRGRITVYKTNSHGTLTRTKEYEPHELCKPDLPLLPKGVVEDVLGDVREFLQSGDFYKELGIPYRRGYLFHGSPGSGKTTLVKRMASEFHMDIVTVSLSSASMGGDEWLASVFSRAPGKSILLIEDIDVAFPSKGINLKRSKGDQKADDEGAANSNGGLTGSGSGFTLSGLFNAIDGISAQESCVLVLTTNHPEKLDPALTRSGRIDVKVPFGPVRGAEAAAAYLRFFPARFELARAFGDAVDQYNMRVAAAKQQPENSDENAESVDTDCMRSASASASPLNSNSAAVSYRVSLVDVSASDRPWTMSDVQEQLIRFRKNPERAASAPVSASASASAA